MNLFRHAHKVAFQKSDLFFICMLRPVSNEIKIDETEIQAAKVIHRPSFAALGSYNMFRASYILSLFLTEIVIAKFTTSL